MKSYIFFIFLFNKIPSLVNIEPSMIWFFLIRDSSIVLIPWILILVDVFANLELINGIIASTLKN